MQNAEHNHGGSRTPGARVKEFFARLRGLWAPKYIPKRIRCGDKDRKNGSELQFASSVTQLKNKQYK